MAKIYVAGKDINRAQLVMRMLREGGHTITFDWLADIQNEKDKIRKAKDERDGVRVADALVYLWESDQESARYEAGMAMGLKKLIVISGGPNSFFFTLENIMQVQSDEEIIDVLKRLIPNMPPS
ncbi:hypothetical protein HYS79_00960 [Patescibacteria group bacterium]|nr:hypothetical protein [Patescibacteria group bacterium]